MYHHLVCCARSNQSEGNEGNTFRIEKWRTGQVIVELSEQTMLQ
jgi:hypothetical protein